MRRELVSFFLADGDSARSARCGSNGEIEFAPDLAASKKAAQEMVSGFHMAHQAALITRHEEGLAVDMNITWSGELTIADAKGKSVTIKTSPQNNNNKELQAVALAYNVHKLASDFPHWSSDGH